MKVSGHYREGGRSSGVAIKRGSTVQVAALLLMGIINNISDSKVCQDNIMQVQFKSKNLM